MHGRRSRLLASLMVGSLGLPAPALAWPSLTVPFLLQAAPKRPEIGRAEAQLERGEFEEAVKTVEAGLDAPDVTDDELVELYRLLGLISLYLGDGERASEAYEKLLQARPDFELPRSAPPKIKALYARLKEDIKSRRVRPVTLWAEPLPDVAGDVPVTLSARIQDMALGAKARLFFRRAGAQNYSSVDFVRVQGEPERFTATLPAYELPAQPSAYQVEYYLEVLDAAQRRLAGRGDTFSPLVFEVSPEQAAVPTVASENPWYKSPWLWVAVGVVGVGATAGAIVYTSSTERGTVPVTIRVTP